MHELTLSQQPSTVLFAPRGALHPQMWKSVVGHDVSMKVAAEGDDWETDPDFEVLHTSWSVVPLRWKTCRRTLSESTPVCLCVAERHLRAGAEVGGQDYRGLGT